MELDLGQLLRRAMGATLAVVVIALLLAPGRALAADGTIDFSALATGTDISNQYQAQDVVFGQSPSGPDQLQPLTVAAPSVPPPSSGAKLGTQSCSEEVCQVYQWISFTAPMNHFSVDVIASGFIPVTVTAQDGGGNTIDSVTHTVNNSGYTQFSVSAPGNATTIEYVDITTGIFVPQTLSITDLTYGPLPVTPPQPDFGLVPKFGIGGAGINVVAGGAATPADITLRRYNGSSGAIVWSPGPLPAGVSLTVQPDPDSAGDFSTVVASFTANKNAPPVVNFPVKITGLPVPGAGTVTHSVTIPVTVTGNFDLRVQGIDVTQGVQPSGTLLPPFSPGPYLGVNLVAFKQTVVRVYADVHGLPGGISGATVILHAFRNGHELPGSPLNADYGPTTLTDTGESNPPVVNQAERISDSHAFTFTLPPEWVDGTLNLVADIIPPEQGFSGPQMIECPSAACQANNSFTLVGVHFSETNSYSVCPVALTINGTQPPAPDQTFLYAKAVTPGILFVPDIYLGTIDETGNIGSSYAQNGQNTQDDVEDWDDDNGKYCNGSIGVTPTGTNGLTSGNISEVDYNPANSGDNRPLSSVAHELFHQYGLPHASNECGGGGDGDNDDHGQSGESWSPTLSAWPAGMQLGSGEASAPSDGIGQLNGIGLDTTSEPYKILANGLNGVSQYLDFMSYCFPPGGGIGGGDVGQWISPRNWGAAFSNVFFNGNARDAKTSAKRVRSHVLRWVAAIHPSQLRVIGFITSAGVKILSVGPNIGPGALKLSTANSSMTLLSRDARGHTLKSVQMAVTPGHMDFIGPLDTITGVIPAAGVDSVAVESSGTVVATKMRPKHPPRVRVLAPRRGARVGRRRTVVVRWTGTNPEHLKLKASVDYSFDGGRTWRTIYIGPDAGHASLSSFYFVGSKRARVRVRVNDGFNEAVAVSATFTALGTPPIVAIETPTKRTRIAGDARLVLSGSAYDQLLRALPGRGMRWYDGPFLLGTGSNLTAMPLPPGRNHIRLTATDAGGSASATAVVNITPVSLRYLRLKVPARVKPHAKTIILTASSAVPSTLKIGRVTFHLSRHAKKLRLRIRPARTPLLLELTSTLHRISTPFAAVVRR